MVFEIVVSTRTTIYCVSCEHNNYPVCIEMLSEIVKNKCANCIYLWIVLELWIVLIYERNLSHRKISLFYWSSKINVNGSRKSPNTITAVRHNKLIKKNRLFGLYLRFPFFNVQRKLNFRLFLTCFSTRLLNIIKNFFISFVSAHSLDIFYVWSKQSTTNWLFKLLSKHVDGCRKCIRMRYYKQKMTPQ